jgi:uncharacterized SAM-binding protein YcdF (DUF218 family)
MFFFGKIAWLIAQPLSLAFIFTVLALSFVWFRWKRTALLCSLLAISIMFVTLFTSTGAWALQKLEARYVRGELPAQLSCVIVLGGAIDLEASAGRGSIEMNQSADRFIEAARIAHMHPETRIVVSGGDGSFSARYKGDAELAGNFFESMGLLKDRILAEKTSRNTAENVENIKALLSENGLSNCLLITSAYHMPRSVALFEKAGVSVQPWPVDYRTSGQVAWKIDFTQPTLNAQLTSTAMREWIALFSRGLTF